LNIKSRTRYHYLNLFSSRWHRLCSKVPKRIKWPTIDLTSTIS